MKRIIVGCIVFCVLLTGCTSEKPDQRDAISYYRREVGELKQADLQQQKKLVRWYNLNLSSASPELGFERSFYEILFFRDGMLGYIEFPGQEVCVPIYRDKRENSFRMNPDTYFPTGDRSDETKLYTDMRMILGDGEIFEIHILDEVYRYQVCGEGKSNCVLFCGDTYYEGIFMVED